VARQAPGFALALTGTSEKTMPADHAFEIDSTVGRYWLANGSGFELVERGGRKLGVVEDVELDPSTQRVDAMVVKRRAAIGRARVPPQDLTLVVPAARLFIVAPGTSKVLTHRAGREIASSASAEARRLASGAAPVLATAGRAIARGAAASARFARAHWPALRHALAVAGATVARTTRRFVAEAHRSWVSGRRARGDR
jgi:hypothetical protein